MVTQLNRRTFFKKAGLTAAALHLSLKHDATDASVNHDALPSASYQQSRIPTVCAICPARCHMIGRIKQGRLIKLEGNPKSSYNGAKICARGQAAIKLLYDPDRLKYPLKRIGARGEGRWARISWAEAIDTVSLEIERKLKRYGPESLALFANGSSSAYIRELFEALDVVHINNASFEQCDLNRNLAYQLTFGLPAGKPDFKNTQCAVLIGTHLGENVHVAELYDLTESLAKGAKLIVVDPRASTIAAKANYHLMIRPGSDTALLLGWINYIIEAGLYDVGFVANHVEGFAFLREQASHYPLNRVAELTDIPAGQIRDTAKLMAKYAPATVIHPGKHSSWYGNDVQRLRAQAILTGLLGSWGRKGGVIPPQQFVKKADEKSFFRQSVSKADELNLYSKKSRFSSTIKEILNKKIKFIGCWGQNPFHSYPNPYRTAKAFKNSDFIFVCDVLPSEPSLYADIVLPEATFLERADVLEMMNGFDKTSIAMRFPVIQPRFETKDPYWIAKQLSLRLGQDEGFQYEDVFERLESQLAEFDLTVEKLLKNDGVADLPSPSFEGSDIKSCFPTPSGKVEFASNILTQKEYPAVPDYEPVLPPPSGFLRLLYGRSPAHSGSSSCNNSWLNHEVGENELWINDELAEVLGLKNGEKLFLENQEGLRSLRSIKIKVTPGIRKDCVYTVHGFGSRSMFLSQAYNRGVSDSALMTRGATDPISGTRGMRVNFIRLIKKGIPLDISVV